MLILDGTTGVPVTTVTGTLPVANGGTGVTTAIDYGFKNRIINGAMVIDQRNAGASVTPTDGQYLVDRFKISASQASKLTAQQNSGAVTPPAGFIKYQGIVSSSAYSIVAGDIFAFQQSIEGLNIADLAWGTASASTVTLSFWVRSSLTGTFGGSIANDGVTRSYPYTYTISTANTWEQKSVTIAGDTTGTWVTDNGTGIRLYFGLGVGSTYSGTAGSWAAAGYRSATGATSVVGTNGATFYITGVQLEKGSTATSFDYRPYGTELQLCQRYYEIIQPAQGYQMLASGFVTATTNGAFFLSYLIKRTSPSFTFTAGNTFVVNNGADTATAVTAIAINGGRIGTQSANVFATVASGLTVGNGCTLNAGATAASCSINISAEL